MHTIAITIGNNRVIEEPSTDGSVLLENGSYLLLENGDELLLG